MGGNQVENNATLWSNLQDCKISSQVEIPRLDPSVAIVGVGTPHNIERTNPGAGWWVGWWVGQI